MIPFRFQVAILTILAVPTPKLLAQPIVKPVNATVNVPASGVFTVLPSLPALVQNSQTGNLCSPGACYVGSITVKGNRAWQLQVRLASSPSGFTVNYVQTAVPPAAQAVNSGSQASLNSNNWITIATGNSATAGSEVGMMFNANKVGGKKGFVPTGGQLSPVIAYRVIANP